MSRNIRRVRRNANSYIPSYTPIRGNIETEEYVIRRIPKTVKCATPYAGQPTLAQRVSCLESEVADINVALAEQTDELNNHEHRIDKLENCLNNSGLPNSFPPGPLPPCPPGAYPDPCGPCAPFPPYGGPDCNGPYPFKKRRCKSKHCNPHSPCKRCRKYYLTNGFGPVPPFPPGGYAAPCDGGPVPPFPPGGCAAPCDGPQLPFLPFAPCNFCKPNRP